jgi:peptide/nickel transport system substrate-binding protein
MNKTNSQSVLTSALSASLLLAGVMTTGLAQAKSFKWTSASDIATLDIPSQNIEVVRRPDNRLDWTLIKVN